MVRPVWHLNILSPPLVMSKEQIDHLVVVLKESVLNVAEGLKA
jgi:adenosylmethionine-8-amino-7-oxononanoate aminotransferase